MYRTGLRLYVEAAFAARRNPGLLCQLERAQAHGWDRCPRCGMRLGLEGYRRTETRFMCEEILVCTRCGARHVLECEVIH